MYRFRLAALQLKRLQSKPLLLSSDIENVLNSLPNDINSMYDKILQEDIHKDHRLLAMKVLRWLAVSYRPLSIMEISEACTIPPESELRGVTTLKQDHRLTHGQLLNLLPDLVVSIQAEWVSGEGPWYTSLAFAHFSVQEYLIGSSSANSRVRSRDAHTLVARECLAYLFISREMELKGSLARYADEHWHLHAVATGELDENTRRNAFLLSASVLAGDEPVDKKNLPEDFVRLTQWLDDQKTVMLISSMRAWGWYRLANGTGPGHRGEMRLIILYPRDSKDSMVRCRLHSVSPMYAPSYDAIHCYPDYSDCVLEISLNDRSLLVTKNTFQLLQDLLRSSTTVRLIWLDSICTYGPQNAFEYRGFSQSSKMYKRPERVLFFLDWKLELDSGVDGWFRGYLQRPTPVSILRSSKRGRSELYLTALEKLESVTGNSGPRFDLDRNVDLHFARDVVFLYDSHELSLNNIRQSLEQHQRAAGLRAVFPKTRALVKRLQRPRVLGPEVSLRTSRIGVTGNQTIISQRMIYEVECL